MRQRQVGGIEALARGALGHPAPWLRASLLIRPGHEGAGAELVATTVVRCHNLFGRPYLFAIAPFHRQVIRSNLSAAAALYLASDESSYVVGAELVVDGGVSQI